MRELALIFVIFPNKKPPYSPCCTAVGNVLLYFFRLFVFVTALVVVLVTAVVGLTAGERFGFLVRAVVAAGSPRASTSLSSF